MFKRKSTNEKRATSENTVYRSEAEFSRALSYSNTRERLAVAGMVWNAALSLGILVSGVSGGLRSFAARHSPARLGPVMLFTALLSGLTFVVSLPFSYFGGFVIEHRYNLSNQRRRAWFFEQVKGLAVGIILGGVLLQGVYSIIRRYPRRWWAILASMTVPLSILMVNLAPVVLLPLFNTFTPLKNRSLAGRIKKLAAQQGVHVSDVLQMDMSKQTKKANAMFTGIGNTKRIILGDTLLEEFTDDEIEVVLAHELGHQVHHDIWKLIALSAPATVVGLYVAHRLSPAALARFGKRWGLNVELGLADVATMPLLGLLAGGTMQAITPIVNGITRTCIERPADRYALDLTGKREAFISAMEKLGRMNLSNPRPSALVKYLFHDHPTLQERIDFARYYQFKQS